MSLLWAVQVAMVARLKADVGVTALVGQRIYDGEAPQGADLPFVVIGDSTEALVPTMGASGGSATLAAKVVSDYDGLKEAMQVVDAIDVALADPLTLTGFGTATARREFIETLVERNGDTPRRLVPLRYRTVSFPA